MKSKIIIVLRGLGGNFKSTIARNLVKEGYVKIPECNRELERTLAAQFNRHSDPELNLATKTVITKAFLDNAFDKYVMDRGLVDYGLMNEFIDKCLCHYQKVYSKLLNTENIFNEELKLMNGYQVINVLLLTKDLNFIKKIIDNSFDERADFYDNYEWYLYCQDLYRDFVKSHYNNLLTIELDNIPECNKYSTEMDEYVNGITQKILNFVKNDK